MQTRDLRQGSHGTEQTAAHKTYFSHFEESVKHIENHLGSPVMVSQTSGVLKWATSERYS